MTQVSVIICCHNDADTVPNALKSLYQQTLPRDAFEVLLINDGSTDALALAITRYQHYRNFRYVAHATTQGLAASCNHGLREATGDYIIRLDADDTFAPTILEAAGAPIPKAVEGRSLVPLLKGVVSEGHHRRLITEECTWQAKWALRDGRHKFILARQPDLYGSPMRELYDLQADPGETRNLFEERPDVAREMESDLEGWIADRMKASGRTVDPLVEQGITLGRRHYEARYGKEIEN